MHDEPDLGPWREPIDDEDFEDDGDGECYCAMSVHNATVDSIPAAVEKWLRMPNHYSLAGYIRERQEQWAADRAARMSEEKKQ